MARLLVFGVNGAIGSAIAQYAAANGFEVVGTARKAFSAPYLKSCIVYSSEHPEKDRAALAGAAPYDAICWAQGANVNDSVYTLSAAKHLEIYKANCLFVLITLEQLLSQKLLAKPARMVVISSIWQHIARQNKLSYTMSKSALLGLVQSAAIDLGQDGHLINAVLPGVLDTPMTRANLSPQQLEGVISATSFNRLATPEDVASLTCFLCSAQNKSVTGQSIAVDLGFSNAHRI